MHRRPVLENILAVLVKEMERFHRLRDYETDYTCDFTGAYLSSERSATGRRDVGCHRYVYIQRLISFRGSVISRLGVASGLEFVTEPAVPSGRSRRGRQGGEQIIGRGIKGLEEQANGLCLRLNEVQKKKGGTVHSDHSDQSNLNK